MVRVEHFRLGDVKSQFRKVSTIKTTIMEKKVNAGRKRRLDETGFSFDKAPRENCEPEPKQVKQQSETEKFTPPQRLEDLKPEFFCIILGFLGPTSQSLISLAMVNKQFSGTMGAIGRTMLPTAESHFRIPLKPKSGIESSTSLFVRHTRMCSKILLDMTNLRNTFNKDPYQIPNSKIQEALTTVLELLEISPALATTLERQVLWTCGKCGGKLFKFCKHVLKNNFTLEKSSFENGNKPLNKDFFQSMLDFSQRVMKTVVYREIQLSKQVRNSTTTYIEKRDAMSCMASALFLKRI